MKNLIVAVDHGNAMVKTPHRIFACGLKCNKKRPSNGESIKFRGMWYTLTNERTYLEDKTQNINCFVLTLFAIAKEITYNREYENGMEISLSVGLPPEHMYDSEKKDNWAKYFTQFGRKIEFEYNDKNFSIYIKRVDVSPQGYAAVFAEPALFANKYKSYIVDVGGYTVDVLTVQNGVLDNHLIRSLPMGIITFFNAATNQVKTDTGINIQEDNIEEFLRTGTTNRKDVTEALERTWTEYATKLVNKLRELEIDLRIQNVVFMGGGASYLEKEIKKVSEDSKSVNIIRDIKANAVGYKKITEYLLSKKRK